MSTKYVTIHVLTDIYNKTVFSFIRLLRNQSTKIVAGRVVCQYNI